MLPETPDTKPDSMEFIIHWAQWWARTERMFLGAPSGTAERKQANIQHEQAKQNLRQSLGFRENEHG